MKLNKLTLACASIRILNISGLIASLTSETRISFLIVFLWSIFFEYVILDDLELNWEK